MTVWQTNKPIVYNDIKEEKNKVPLKNAKQDEYTVKQEAMKDKTLEPPNDDSSKTVGEHEIFFWRRGFARLIDAFWVLCFLWCWYSILFQSSSSSATDSLQPSLPPTISTTYTHSNYWYVLSISSTIFIFASAILLIESLVYAVFGNTLAKWGFSFQVTDKLGKKISFRKYFLRNIYILTGGYFLPPPFCLFFLEKEEARLRQGQETSYDEQLELRFVHNNVSWGKATLKFLVLVGVTVIWCYLLVKISFLK